MNFLFAFLGNLTSEEINSFLQTSETDVIDTIMAILLDHSSNTCEAVIKGLLILDLLLDFSIYDTDTHFSSQFRQRILKRSYIIVDELKVHDNERVATAAQHLHSTYMFNFNE